MSRTILVKTDKSGFSEKYDISEKELRRTPPAVLSAFINEIRILTERTEKSEARLNKNPGDPHKPPSPDPPYKDKPENEKRKGRGAGKGHKGHGRQLPEPAGVHELKPAKCLYGCKKIETGDP